MNNNRIAQFFSLRLPKRIACLRKRYLSTSVQTPTSVTNATVTTHLDIIDTLKFDKWKMYRILDPCGKVLDDAVEPLIDKNTMLKMYKMVVRIQTLDDVFYNVQRQGRISFYMQSSGEESIHIGM